jgi:hypothetical protein
VKRTGASCRFPDLKENAMSMNVNMSQEQIAEHNKKVAEEAKKAEEEAKKAKPAATATPPGPSEVKPTTPVVAAAPASTPAARPRIAFSSLSARERLVICRVARNQEGGGALPLDVRRAILSDYEGIPESSFSPDPTGSGWAERVAAGAEQALMVILGAAAGAMGLLLLVEMSKAVLRATGVMAPAPKVLPPVTVEVGAPGEVGINEGGNA